MKEDLQKLEEEHTKKVNSLFMMCLEILLIFGIPALVVLLTYKLYAAESSVLMIGLPVAFFLSWVVFFLRWKKISTEVIELESRLKRAREEQKEPEETTKE